MAYQTLITQKRTDRHTDRWNRVHNQPGGWRLSLHAYHADDLLKNEPELDGERLWVIDNWSLELIVLSLVSKQIPQQSLFVCTSAASYTVPRNPTFSTTETFIYTPCLKKTVQNCFCQNFDKCPPILIIFGRNMAKRLKLCKMYSLFTSSNLRHHTTVLNADVPNCYATL